MLSLRARLLVLLICVTAAFLLIMGAVSTIVLGKRLGNEFNTQLVAAAQHSPQQIASNPGDYVAVEITYLPVQVRPLTGNSAATRELAATVQNLITRHVARYYIGSQPFDVPGTSGPQAARGGPADPGPGQRRDPRGAGGRPPGRRGRRAGRRDHHRRADHGGRADPAAGGQRALADRPGPGPAEPDGQYRAADHLARRPDRPDARGGRQHRGGPARRGHQRHAGPDPAGLRRPLAFGAEGAPVRGRRLARAAHPAHHHPRLRRAVPAGRARPGSAAGRDAPDRAGIPADEHPGRRAARAGPAGPHLLAGPGRDGPGPAGPGRGRGRLGGGAGPPGARRRRPTG